jgi:hypothetical protein
MLVGDALAQRAFIPAQKIANERNQNLFSLLRQSDHCVFLQYNCGRTASIDRSHYLIQTDTREAA